MKELKIGQRTRESNLGFLWKNRKALFSGKELELIDVR